MKHLYLLLTIFVCLSAKAQTTPVPDTNFEQFLIDQGIDTNGLNGNILDADAQAVTDLNINVNTITDFTGLEAFVNLVTLNAGTNQFATLPLTTLTQLEELTFDDNNILASLDVSQNVNLRILNIGTTGSTGNIASITDLDLSNNTLLEFIYIYAFLDLVNLTLPQTTTLNEISIIAIDEDEFDFTAYSNLETLNLNQNRNTTSILLPAVKTNLKFLDIRNQVVNTIDLDGYVALEEISLSGTEVETLILPSNTVLKKLNVSRHKLPSVYDLSMVSNIESLTINSNLLTTPFEVNIRALQNLTILDLTNNKMVNLDMTQNTKLLKVNVSSNDLVTFDLSQNILLEDLNASRNQITNLDLTTNVALETLNLSYNQLPTLDLSTNILLNNVNLGNNLLPALDVTFNTKLGLLSINDNLFTGTGLDLTQNPDLHYLNASNNEIESLNITQNTRLGSLILHHNLFTGTDIMNQYYDIWNSNGALGASDELDVGFNLLTGKIPDFASLALDRRTNYFELKFNDNFFHFGDFEAEHLDYVDLLSTYWATIPSLPLFREYLYAPQAKVNEIENLTPNAGDNLTLITTVRGAQNHYKWFKDGVEIPDAPDSPEYIIYDVNDCDSGVYHSEITSDLVPFENTNPPGTGGKNLLLVRNDITVNVNVNKTCVNIFNPSHQETDVPINSGIEWVNNPGACGYILSVGTSAGGVDIVDKLDMGDVELYNFENDLPANQDIYVTIVPYFSDGEITGCSEEMFTTSNTTVIPDCTQLSTPFNNATGVDVNTDLSWGPANAADSYIVRVGTTSGSDDIFNQTVNALFYDFPDGTFQPGTTYFVTITPTNSIGDATGCAEESFATETLLTPPGCTTLSTPVDGATDVAIGTNLSWNASAEATGYNLTVGTTPGGMDILDNVDLGNVTTHDLPDDLPEDTEIFVSVIPYNSAGNATGCAEESFMTETLPTPPGCTTLSTPVDGATDVAIGTNLSWNASAEATGYILTMGTTPGGMDILDNVDLGNVTTHDLPDDLPANTEIFVSVIPYNSAGNATGCAEESFMTEKLLTPPGCTSITSPVDGAVDVTINTRITWDDIENAEGYIVTISHDPMQTDILEGTIVSESFIDPSADLPEGQLLYVSVIPYNGVGTATGCEPISFTTAAKVLETKYGISPNGDGKNDFWEIPGIEDYPDNTVRIYNRWGDLVYEGMGYDNLSTTFNGTANQKTGMGAGELPNGTYFFTIETAGESEFNNLKGFIVIRR
ncbi:MAG: hypothetical protein CL868_03530 [Cytophagaceae bacterium]|nr:hypothetical protein [Cytophagaceae bacterium]